MRLQVLLGALSAFISSSSSTPFPTMRPRSINWTVPATPFNYTGPFYGYGHIQVINKASYKVLGCLDQCGKLVWNSDPNVEPCAEYRMSSWQFYVVDKFGNNRGTVSFKNKEHKEKNFSMGPLSVHEVLANEDTTTFGMRNGLITANDHRHSDLNQSAFFAPKEPSQTSVPGKEKVTLGAAHFVLEPLEVTLHWIPDCSTRPKNRTLWCDPEVAKKFEEYVKSGRHAGGRKGNGTVDGPVKYPARHG